MFLNYSLLNVYKLQDAYLQITGSMFIKLYMSIHHRLLIVYKAKAEYSMFMNHRIYVYKSQAECL